jgi:hypothetical protein
MFKKWWEISQANIAILINSSGNHTTSMFFKPGRIIGATAKKGNPERSPGNNHGLSPCLLMWLLNSFG